MKEQYENFTGDDDAAKEEKEIFLSPSCVFVRANIVNWY